jgi:hypothetical protein
MTPNGAFAALLRDTEGALHLTPEAFAEVLKVAPATLDHWKRGEHFPSPEQHAAVMDRIEVVVLSRRPRGQDAAG